MENTFEQNLKSSWDTAAGFVVSKLDDFNSLGYWQKVGLITVIHFVLRWARPTK